MDKINSYCYQRGSIWYFRKKITKGKIKYKKKDYIYKISLKKLLGQKAYFKAILQGNLFTITNYINNNLEILLFEMEGLTLEELNKFTSDLLTRYESEALMSENDYTQELGTRKKKIEDLRFSNLTYFDEIGTRYGGHTPKALTIEIEELQKAYDTENRGLIRKKATEILRRQDIISIDEISKLELLDNDIRFEFEEALVKKEIEVLQQDIRNYQGIVTQETNSSDVLNLLAQVPELKGIIENIEKGRKEEFDNWDFLIESYMKSLNSANNVLRGEEVAIFQFSQMMKGDNEFGIVTRSLLTCTNEDINKLKELFIGLPNLKMAGLEFWREKGIIYTIKYTEDKRVKFPKILLTGIQEKIKTVHAFLEFINLTVPKYKELDLRLWKKFLKVIEKDLSAEDRAFNKQQKKQALKSEYINGFLIDRYRQKESNVAGTADRNFTRHTQASPHIFWSLMLGLFTGARAEELAQLRLDDIKKKETVNDVIFYIDFNISDYETQSIKNLSSERKTPICNKLIELGFLNYVKSRKALGRDTLFDLKVDKDGKRKEFQKSFNNDIKNYLRQEYPDLSNYRYSFHGLRAHFVSKFLNDESDNISKLIQLKKLIGHTHEDIHKDITIEHYDKEELELSKGKVLIDNMDFMVDEGYEAVRELMLKKIDEILLEI